MMQEGLGQLAQVGSVIGAPMFVSLLVEALMVAGMHEVALGTVTQALSDSRDRGNVWMDAELLRLKAELELATDPAAGAEARALLEQSMAEARRTGSRSYELRSICSAHRLGIDKEGDQARLAELSRELPEGRDTPEHQAMAAILAAAG
jgi:predicted ATPase